MLETRDLKEGRKSQKQTIKKIIKYPECCALELPASSLLLFTLLHSIPQSPSFRTRGGGSSAVSHLRLNCLFCRFWAEHWFRLGGAHWENLLLLQRSRWPGLRCRRPCACCHVLHGRDPGGAAMCWPLEEVPWHWDWNDHHQSGEVRMSFFGWRTRFTDSITVIGALTCPLHVFVVVSVKPVQLAPTFLP